MQMSQLVPASKLAQNFGVKSVLYGEPGSGKTPLMATAPRPVLLVTEPGMLSMRNIHNVPAWEAYTIEKVNEFFKWFFESNESKNFDTLAMDSVSQYAELELERCLKQFKDGRKAYGEMSINVMANINKLYYTKSKHICLIAKQGFINESGVDKKRPYFPGQDLNTKIPHMFDEILFLGKASIPQLGGQVMQAIRTRGTIDITARDRSMQLDELEQPNLSEIFRKCML